MLSKQHQPLQPGAYSYFCLMLFLLILILVLTCQIFSSGHYFFDVTRISKPPLWICLIELYPQHQPLTCSVVLNCLHTRDSLCFLFQEQSYLGMDVDSSEISRKLHEVSISRIRMEGICIVKIVNQIQTVIKVEFIFLYAKGSSLTNVQLHPVDFS